MYHLIHSCLAYVDSSFNFITLEHHTAWMFHIWVSFPLVKVVFVHSTLNLNLNLVALKISTVFQFYLQTSLKGIETGPVLNIC